jgi:outer membrane receptor for ferrienterochelin and colicin
LSTFLGTAYNVAANPDRAQLQALCSAQINAWGGNNSTDFHTDPNTFNIAGGAALIVGNPDLLNEQADTYTFGVAFSRPEASITGTVDWYRARVTDPIEVQQTGTIVNSCFNVNGLNPTYSLADERGYCGLIERDPSSGAITRVYNSFDNQGKLEISGVDTSLTWSTDVGQGILSVNTNMNYLIDQIQRYGADLVDDYAGFGGASKFRANTGVTYSWGNGRRVTLTWNYRDGTDTPTTFATAANAAGTAGPSLQTNQQITGYQSTSLFNLAGSTLIGQQVTVSLSVSNLLDEEPRAGGYDVRDPRYGFGTFSPFDDLVGRRYLFNVTMDF